MRSPKSTIPVQAGHPVRAHPSGRVRQRSGQADFGGGRVFLVAAALLGRFAVRRASKVRTKERR